MAEKFLLEMQHINKTFPGVRALDDVNFHVREGEVHALMGENGAGKSTLIKILTGLYTRNGGEIIFDGKNVDFNSPMDSQKNGISTIYQEINLIPYLSVAENIFIGREPMTKFGIDWRSMNEKAKDILTDMKIDIDVTRELRSYSTAIQQMIAIARAINQEAKLLVLDEPTSSLDEEETAILFDQMRKLKSRGMSMIFISHKLDEIFEISDMVTILKDGKLVEEVPIGELTKLALVSKMIGYDATDILKKKNSLFDAKDKEVLISTDGIKDGVKLNGMNITVHRGEIVGLAGLLGSGRTELAKVIFGETANYNGEVFVKGVQKKFRSPHEAIEQHFAYCPEDRKVDGILPHMSVRENLSIAILPKIAKTGVVDEKRQREIVEEFIESLNIKTPSPEQQIRNLSGGNQQKVLLGRWLCMEPELIILDEPTRGIDVGAKSEIESLIQKIAEQGIGVLFISSELEELVRNCHRIIVVRDGKNVGELTGEEIAEKNIMALIARGSEEVA